MSAKIKYLLLAAPVPETKEFLYPGVGGAGNLAIRGIADGLYAYDSTCEVAGFWNMRVWPRSKKILIGSRVIKYDNGLKVRILPEVNLPIFRAVSRSVIAIIAILKWAIAHRGSNRVVLIYNYSVPPIWSVFLASVISSSKIVPIVFDVNPVGVMESIRRFFLRRILGSAVIVGKIREVLFPTKSAILIDGGVSPEIKKRLFDLRRSEETSNRREVVFLLAGSLCGYNGIDLALDSMKINKNQKIRLIIAGGCSNADRIKIDESVSSDSRIKYCGKLPLNDLFDLYKEIDVFLNLRITQKYDMSCFFPSKFLEALTVGRCVITTNVAHLRETYGQFCHVLDDESPECLSLAMDHISTMEREERDAFGEKSRTYMLSCHTWTDQMRRFCTYCENLIEGKYDNCYSLVLNPTVVK